MIHKNHIVIVVSYNDIKTTIEFIDNSKKLNTIDKIVIVDNCSSNDLFNIVNEYIRKNNLQDWVDCIQSEKNGGYSYGNNYGVKYAISNYNPKYISISNADVILNDEAISGCLDSLEKNNQIGLIAPTMITPELNKIRSYWILPTYKMLLKRNFIWLNARIRKSENWKFETKDDILYAPCINGSYFMTSVETFKKIGFLDEGVFLYDEESILGYKIKNIGLKNAILLNCTYIHNHKGSIEQNIKSKRKQFSILHKSHMYYLEKYVKINVLQKILFKISYHMGLNIFLVGYYIKKNILK